jgi:hypothetical protein
MAWVEAVLAELHAFVTWPVISLKLDDLYAEFKAREARDACRLSYRLTVGSDGAVAAVTVASGGGACVAPLMVSKAAGVKAGGAGRWDRGQKTALTQTLRVPLAVGQAQRVLLRGLWWTGGPAAGGGLPVAS